MAYIPNSSPPPNYNRQPFNPRFNGEGWTGGGSANPFDTQSGGRDVYNMYQGIGQNQFQQSQDWQNEFGGMADYYNGQAANYGQGVNDLYNPIWQGGGGYTPEMQGNILQSQGLQDVQGQLPNNYLDEGEQQRIMGNPYAGKDFFAGQAASLSAQAGDYGQDIRQQANAGDARGHAALDEMRQGYGGALGELKQGYQNAIDPSQLRMSAGYQPQMDRTLSGARSDVGAAQSDPGLNLTGEYRQQAGMSDQEVQDTAGAAARGVGAQFQATKDQLDQDAAASGTASPLGLAAARTALDRSSAAGQADARTNAQLAARGQQRQAAQGVQSTALQAGQYRAGLGSSNALALEGADLGARQGAEGMRLGAEQGLTAAQMQAAQGLGDRSLEATSNLGREAVGQGQYITNAGMGASTQAGNWGLNTGQYNASMGTGLEQSGEAAAQARGASIAGNRQGTAQYNQGVNLGINNATSGRYQQSYQPWVSAQQEGRAAAQGQQQYYGGQGNQQNQFRGSGWQTGQGGQLGAAQGYSGWGSSGGQGFGDYLGRAVAAGMGQAIGGAGSSAGGAGAKKAFGFEHGGVIDHNHLIEVGEGDRPEAILPLDSATPPEHQNMWERMGSHLGEKLGMRQGGEIPGYAEGGIVGDDFQQPGDFGGFRPPSQPPVQQSTAFQQPRNFGGFMPDLSQQAPSSAPQNSVSGISGGDPHSNQAAATPNLDVGRPAYQPQSQPFQQPGNFGGFRPQQQPQAQPQFQQPGNFGGFQPPPPQQQPSIPRFQPQRSFAPQYRPQQMQRQPMQQHYGYQQRQAPQGYQQQRPMPYGEQRGGMQYGGSQQTQQVPRQGGWVGQQQHQQPQGFAHGGIVPKHMGPLKFHSMSGGYRMNAGRHHSPMPVPLSEMGSMAKPAYA